MSSRASRWASLASFLLGVLALSGCESSGEGTGSNTNWLTCQVDADCPERGLCLAQECRKLTAAACASGAKLELANVEAPLEARQGSYFQEAMYVPVEDVAAEQAQRIVPAAIVARVRDAEGMPLEGCTVSWFTSADGGWVYPNGETTGPDGAIAAAWVAGRAEDEELTAALVDESGAVVSARVRGHSLPHDAEPRSEGGPPTTHATTVYLNASLSEGADAVRVHVLPRAAGHHAYFIAAILPGFYTGLQNTSDEDAFAAAVPPEARLLLASVWNTDSVAAEVLWQAPAAVCGPHTQDQGGLKCELADAWQTGSGATITVEARTLASGDAAPSDYAALGYATTPCASTAGCTDYTVFLAKDGTDTAERVVAYRHPAAATLSSLAASIDAYVASEEQTSCLAVPRYEAEYVLEERVSGSFAPITLATAGAAYSSGDNRICANHALDTNGSAFVLSTGGDLLSRRPLRPGEADATLVVAPP